MALEQNKVKYPSIPDYARVCYNYSDKTANGLTRCIIDFLKLSGHYAERINTTGIYREGKTFKDVVGFTRITPGMWTPGGATPGSSDISAVIHGKAVKVEVKIGKDRMSEAQVKYKEKVEAAGAVYYVARSFTEFYEWYNSILIKQTNHICK